MTADLILIALLVVGFAVGYIRGAVRQLLALGAGLVALLLAANVRSLIGGWLSEQWPHFQVAYVEMLVFAMVFVLVFLIGFAFAQVSGGRTTITRHERPDAVLGALLGTGLVILTLASVYVILASYYGVPTRPGGQDIGLLRELHVALDGSAIIGALRDSLLPGLGAILSPLLPPDIRAVMG